LEPRGRAGGAQGRAAQARQLEGSEPMRTRVVVPLLAIALVAVGHAQRAEPTHTRADVEALASERFEGREAGSPGERGAAEYLAAELARIGARPLPGQPTMFEAFDFTAGSRDGGSRVTGGTASKALEGRDVVQAHPFSDDATVTAAAVFAGYGIVVPESQNFGYDSHAGLEVK